MVRQRHQCPSCGAALGIPDDHDAYFRCGFCGTVIEDRGRREPTDAQDVASTRIELRVGSVSDPEQLAQYRGAARAVGAVVSVVALLVVVAGAFAVYLLAREVPAGVADTDENVAGDAPEPGDPVLGISSVTTAAVVVADDDSSPDVVLVGRGGDAAQTAYVDLDAESKVRWSDTTQVAVGPYSPFVVSDDVVILSAEDSLIARSRESGGIAWESMLTDVIQHNICPGCVQVFGDALVTLTADGMLRATDLSTGETRWEVRLEATPRQIVDLGGRPAVLDPVDGVTRLVVFEPTTGEVVERLSVGCPNESFGGVDDPSEYSPMVPAGDGTSVWIAGGTMAPCVQRFDAGASDAAITVPLGREPGLPSWDHDNLVLADGHLFLAGGPRVLAIDAATGEVARLLDDPDLDMVPVDAADGVLVVAAETRRGSSSWQLLGLDTELATVVWRFDIEADERYGSTGRPVDAGGHWDAALTSGGVTVLQVTKGQGSNPLAQPARVVLQSIPLRSGTASAPVTHDVVGSVSAWTLPIAWRGNRVWLLTDTLLSVLDAVEGQLLDSLRL